MFSVSIWVPPGAGDQRTGVRLILAEDDSSLRRLFASALELEGYEVVQASTGDELVNCIRGFVAREERIDLLISDVRMPKTSGLLALQLIRDAEIVLPVILITAFSDVWTRREAAEYGAVLLDKPIRLRTLRDAVRRALKHGTKSRS